MCRFRSYIVTETDILSSELSDSHEDIIEHYNLDDSTLKPTFVRVEISPLRMLEDKFDTSEWSLTIDQDYLPDWFSTWAVSERVRAHLAVELQNPVYQAIVKHEPLDDSFAEKLRVYVAVNLPWHNMTRQHFLADKSTEVRLAILQTTCLRLDEPLTPAEEPDPFVRAVSARVSLMNRLLTAAEEPCYAVRYVQAAESIGSNMPDFKMPTEEQEPDVFNRYAIWGMLVNNELARVPYDVSGKPLVPADNAYDAITLVTGTTLTRWQLISALPFFGHTIPRLAGPATYDEKRQTIDPKIIQVVRQACQLMSEANPELNPNT